MKKKKYRFIPAIHAISWDDHEEFEPIFSMRSLNYFVNGDHVNAILTERIYCDGICRVLEESTKCYFSSDYPSLYHFKQATTSGFRKYNNKNFVILSYKQRMAILEANEVHQYKIRG